MKTETFIALQRALDNSKSGTIFFNSVILQKHPNHVEPLLDKLKEVDGLDKAVDYIIENYNFVSTNHHLFAISRIDNGYMLSIVKCSKKSLKHKPKHHA